jgi:hypothetical protein
MRNWGLAIESRHLRLPSIWDWSAGGWGSMEIEDISLEIHDRSFTIM